LRIVLDLEGSLRTKIVAFNWAWLWQWRRGRRAQSPKFWAVENVGESFCRKLFVIQKAKCSDSPKFKMG